MANSLYTLGRAAFANAGVNWLTDTIKVGLVSNGYTPNLATHQFLSDLGANVLNTPAVLATKTNVGGLVSAANVTFTAVATATIPYIALWKDTGVAGTSQLIGLIDTATGLPATANGTNITITWDGVNGIFKL